MKRIIQASIILASALTASCSTTRAPTPVTTQTINQINNDVMRMQMNMAVRNAELYHRAIFNQ